MPHNSHMITRFSLLVCACRFLSASALPCTSGPITSLMQLGSGGCTIGGDLYSNFSYRTINQAEYGGDAATVQLVVTPGSGQYDFQLLGDLGNGTLEFNLTPSENVTELIQGIGVYTSWPSGECDPPGVTAGCLLLGFDTKGNPIWTPALLTPGEVGIFGLCVFNPEGVAEFSIKFGGGQVASPLAAGPSLLTSAPEPGMLLPIALALLFLVLRGSRIGGCSLSPSSTNRP